MAESIVELQIEEDSWLSIKANDEWASFFKKFAEATVNRVCNKDINFSISLILTNDADIQEMNKQIRNIDKATNVLSFPHYCKSEIESFNKNENILLGEVVMSYNTVNEEASLFGKMFVDRVAHLFVHGMLHTLGLDHATDQDRCNMEMLETEILNQFNITDPYLCTFQEK